MFERQGGAAGDARSGRYTISRSNAWIVGHSISCSAAGWSPPRPAPFAPRGLAAAEPIKAGFVYLGPVGDFGWTYQHDVARKEAEDHFGGAVKTPIVENVPEGPDAEHVIADLAAKGCKIVFTTSFGYMNYTLKVAKKFPAVKFEHCTGYKRAANVSTYNIRFYEGRFVQGVIAGKLSKTGVAGYVGSMPCRKSCRA